MNPTSPSDSPPPSRRRRWFARFPDVLHAWPVLTFASLKDHARHYGLLYVHASNHTDECAALGGDFTPGGSC